MKKFNTLFVLTGLLFGLVACTELKKEDAMEVKKEIPELGCTVEQYEANIQKSLVSLGNNYRLKKVIEKLENGETVYVACIGGSVTEGAGIKDAAGKELWQQGYAFQFRDKLMEKYPKANIVFNGAGLSGTPSTLGLIRYEDHVVKPLDNHNPDLLVIEFAVNDGGELEYVAATEALVRKVYGSNENSAVIFLYADAKSYRNSQEAKKPIGTFYRVPQVSIQDAVEASDSGISEDLFFDDYVHPKLPGHIFMADCLMNIFEKTETSTEAKQFNIPESYNPDYDFSNFYSVFANTEDENVKITVGSFSDVDKNTQSMKRGGTAFPSNWHHSAGNGNESFVMELNCKNLIFVYKVQGNWLAEKYGTAEVYVDGNKVAEYNGADAGGWNNSTQKLIINEKECGNHKIEVKMAEGSEDLGFTIVAVGYGK